MTTTRRKLTDADAIAYHLNRAENAQVTLSEGRKVTLVYQGEWGGAHHVVEARLYLHGTRKYAQYDSAAWVIFKPKGKQKLRQLIEGYRPEIVILDGWVKNSVPVGSNWHQPVTSASGVTVQTARDTAFGATWAKEADAAIAASGVSVVADLRQAA